MQRAILKIGEGEANKGFISKVLFSVQKWQVEYEILRRPSNSKALESFDGLLKFYDLESEQVDEIMALGTSLAADFKFLHIDEDTTDLYHFEQGFVNKNETSWKDGMLNDEVYYFEQSLAFHFGEKPGFLESKDFIEVDKIARKYPFLFFDFDDQVMYATDWFCLPKSMKETFLKDMETIKEHLAKHDMSICCGMLGFDAHLNLEKLSVENNQVIFKQKTQ